MRHNPLPPVVLATALSACQAHPELLNSERIQQQFGSYGIEILQQEDGVRRSSLYSVEDSGHVCRTYAVVEFIDPLEPELATTHAAVIGGSSIGTAFRTAGWLLTKETVYVGSVQLPDPSHEIAELMHLEKAATLGLHAYRLILRKQEQAIHYATIIESHHPDYMTAEDLSQLYADDIVKPLGPAAIERSISLVLN
jgi:hypothetical protein